MGPYGPQPGQGPNPDWAPTRPMSTTMKHKQNATSIFFGHFLMFLAGLWNWCWFNRVIFHWCALLFVFGFSHQVWLSNKPASQCALLYRGAETHATASTRMPSDDISQYLHEIMLRLLDEFSHHQIKSKQHFLQRNLTFWVQMAFLELTFTASALTSHGTSPK